MTDPYPRSERRKRLRHDAQVTYRPPSLADVVATLEVERVDEHHFLATQLDNPAHHIVGGHIAGQALMAASLTAPGRTPHSVHVYYIRAGDARSPSTSTSTWRVTAARCRPARSRRVRTD